MSTSDLQLLCRFAVVGAHGLIRRIGMADWDMAALQSHEPDEWVVAPIDPSIGDETHWWDQSIEDWSLFPPRPAEPHYWWGRAWRIYPPQPGPAWVFDPAAGVWTDPRTPAERQAELARARDLAWRDKADLLMFLCQPSVGILTEEEAEQAALGTIPASFQPYLDAMSPELRSMARIKWAGDQRISRQNPLILLAAYSRGISDEQMDAAFGVRIPD